MLTTAKIREILAILIILFLIGPDPVQGQAGIPEVLDEGTLQEQMDFIQDRTRIYENFRAIREDMFQKIRRNSLDSLAGAKMEIGSLKADIDGLNSELSSMSETIEGLKDDLDIAIRNRDSIAFLGIPMNKTGYNLLVWIIIASLATLLVVGFLIFSRNQIVTTRTLKELEELKQEFEQYRISSREKREKLVIEHFNEIKRLKENN